jgi:uncharacterized protein YcaQ
VTGYRVGDHDRDYPCLDIDEDTLYAYGYVARDLHRYLQPRRNRHHPDGVFEMSGRAAEVLAFVREHGVTHPREVQAQFEPEQVANGWGGKSSGTTVDLEDLRHYGYLRVADRVAGVRRYEVAPPAGDPLEPEERLRAVVRETIRILAPAPVSSIGPALKLSLRWIEAPPGGGQAVVRDLISRGELESADVDGTTYVWPADLTPTDVEAPARVRFLAPFDPVVYDRQRFSRLWGWEYRFEAYTPAPKRLLGYYAMPLLWRDRVIGWANCPRAGGDVEVGYVDKAPTGTAYKKALDAEIDRLRTFLLPRPAPRPPSRRS